jgi:hypothetical protein
VANHRELAEPGCALLQTIAHFVEAGIGTSPRSQWPVCAAVSIRAAYSRVPSPPSSGDAARSRCSLADWNLGGRAVTLSMEGGDA